jgi:hypothetical protein
MWVGRASSRPRCSPVSLCSSRLAVGDTARLQTRHNFQARRRSEQSHECSHVSDGPTRCSSPMAMKTNVFTHGMAWHGMALSPCVDLQNLLVEHNITRYVALRYSRYAGAFGSTHDLGTKVGGMILCPCADNGV